MPIKRAIVLKINNQVSVSLSPVIRSPEAQLFSGLLISSSIEGCLSESLEIAYCLLSARGNRRHIYIYGGRKAQVNLYVMVVQVLSSSDTLKFTHHWPSFLNHLSQTLFAELLPSTSFPTQFLNSQMQGLKNLGVIC